MTSYSDRHSLSFSNRSGPPRRHSLTPHSYGVTVRHGSLSCGINDDDYRNTLPQSVIERKMSAAQPDYGANLEGSSINDEVYLIHKQPHMSARKWLVAPYCFLSMAAYISSSAAFTQYLYRRVQEQLFPNVNQINETVGCFVNTSDPNFEMQTRVQQEAAVWSMYYNLAVGIPALFACIFLGSSSDKFGRKFLFVFPCLGVMIRTGVCVAGIYFKFNLKYFIIGFFIEGLLGYIPTMLLACFTYIADITPQIGKKRSLGITLIELFNGVGGTVVSFVFGYFIQDTGFFYPMLTSGILVVIALVLICFLPESFPPDKRNPEGSVLDKIFTSFKFFFSSADAGSRWMYNILILAFSITVLSGFGTDSVEPLYQLNAPFCWSPEKLGYYGAAKYLLQNVVGMGLIKLMQAVMADESIAMIGCVTYAANYAIEGLAQNDLYLYIGAIIGAPGILTVPIIRSLMSKLTSTEKQAAVETIINMGGTAAGNEIYSATISYYRGFVFFIFAGASIVCLICLGIYRVGSRRTFPTPIDV
ncbi:proton-coupled folate transporter-like isoform X2 [Dreissena polymorpha]|uniref:proton-coupled folate transporter-like isoform X2 n=1 Tax=Dreissena polymorpha TaxID=45954 RepID=UPI0022643132|nr:proton-coupled folate transporter-like isoform X2 [Dreissena polymorpha]